MSVDNNNIKGEVPITMYFKKESELNYKITEFWSRLAIIVYYHVKMCFKNLIHVDFFFVTQTIKIPLIRERLYPSYVIINM